MIVGKFMILAIISVALLPTLILAPTCLAYVSQEGMITGVVWADNNKNGVQEIAEKGIRNATIYAQNQKTNERHTTQTANGGGFVILDLRLGNYLVWYEYDDQVANSMEVELDELSGVTSINFAYTSTLSTNLNYTIYLPLVYQP